MELKATLCILAPDDRSDLDFTNWIPGTLSCVEKGISFLERGKTEPLTLDDAEMASAYFRKGFLVISDEVLLVTKAGPRWAFRVYGGKPLVDALVARGVPRATESLE